MPGMETLPFGYREILVFLLNNFKLIIKLQTGSDHGPIHNAQPQNRQFDDSILDLEDVPGSSNWTNRDYLTRYHQ